jgi:hypothetical protein
VSSNGDTWSNATGTGNATASYTPTASDEGQYLRVQVTYTDATLSSTLSARNASTLVALNKALESTGVEFIDENGGGPGVRY